jgi:hypothetical protein
MYLYPLYILIIVGLILELCVTVGGLFVNISYTCLRWNGYTKNEISLYRTKDVW